MAKYKVTLTKEERDHFVAAMEQILDDYKRPYDKANPIVCMDEAPKQLIKEVRKSVSIKPGFEKESTKSIHARIDNINTVKAEVRAWQNHRNNKKSKIKWQFTTDQARIKLHKLYPSIHN